MRPLLIINPIADEGFVRACEESMEPDPPELPDPPDPPDPDELQAALRRRFPEAIVRPRALSGERLVVWYVYRDGHWVSSP